MSNQEKKNRNIGLIASAGIHGGILLILFFLVAWRAPDPPLPEYGIQLNFGLDDQGTGDIQPEEPNVTEEIKEESKPEEQKPQEETEVKPNDVQVTEQPVSKQESPVVVKEEKKEVKPEPVKEKPKEEKPLAEYKKEEKKESKTDATTDGGKTTTSHGDDAEKKGDKGDPEGIADPNGKYTGKPGGGGGGVSMSGFNGFDWPEVVVPSLPNDAEGVYVFNVKVDDQGNVLSAVPAKRGLSLVAERRFIEMIRKLEFIPKGMNLPPESEGSITFKVVSR